MTDTLMRQILADNEQRRAYYGSMLASTEERYGTLETTTWRAVELHAENGDPNRCNELLRKLAKLRDELNSLWVELGKPAPDWALFSG